MVIVNDPKPCVAAHSSAAAKSRADPLPGVGRIDADLFDVGTPVDHLDPDEAAQLVEVLGDKQAPGSAAGLSR